MLLQFTDRGIYCREGDFYIDPWKPVKRALITHAHGDHAYAGHEYYLAQRQSVPILKYRLGNDIRVQSVEYGEDITHNGVRISFHPAGHIIGSSQIRIESNGEVWVASGDYKTENDGITTPFELVKCHAFISESTFGLPIYQWKPQQKIFDQINRWWKKNQSENVSSVLICYALGKAQRILHGVDPSIGPIFAHGAIENINEIFRNAGENIPPAQRILANTKKQDLQQSLVLATNSVLNTAWLRKMAPYSIAYASGWMQVRGNKRRRAADVGFALSDHADWNGLNETIKATGAEKIFITHGYTFPFVKWLREEGWDAEEEKTEYVGEMVEESVEEGSENITNDASQLTPDS